MGPTWAFASPCTRRVPLPTSRLAQVFLFQPRVQHYRSALWDGLVDRGRGPYELSVYGPLENGGAFDGEIVEPDLAERPTGHVASGRLPAPTHAAEAVRTTDVAFVCVGTPSTAWGGIDTTYLDRLCEQIGAAIADQQPEAFHAIVRSMCMPSARQQLQQISQDTSGRRLGEGLGYVCHPEFLREGAAVADFFDSPNRPAPRCRAARHPDRHRVPAHDPVWWPSRSELTKRYWRSCTYGGFATDCGASTTVVAPLAWLMRTEIDPVCRGTVRTAIPAGATHEVTWPPTVAVILAGAVRKVSTSTASRGGVLSARGFIRIEWPDDGSAEANCTR